MSSKVNELKPTMTKAKALELLLRYVHDNGYPFTDVILHADIENDNGQLKTINEWTYQGLKKLLIGE